MGKKRGLLAEINHQAQLAAKRKAQAEKEAAKQQIAAQRQAEKAARDAERAAAQLQRANEAERKAAEKEAKRLHDVAMQADVDARNEELANLYSEIDGILVATLEVDDFVDLETLRVAPEHPPFEPGPIATPTPPPSPIAAPPEPQFSAPLPPKGLGGVLGGKKKHEQAVLDAEREYKAAHDAWRAEMADVARRIEQANVTYRSLEDDRLRRLEAAQATYQSECETRDAEALEANRQLDQLIANLGYDVEEAIQEYVAIVLGNSVYPDAFQVEHDFEFESSTRELTLDVSVPSPSSLPITKAFKYTKSTGEISKTELSQKAQKDRFSDAVYATALRTVHEVFEADRAGRIHTVSLVVQTHAVNPATGQMTATPLVAVASDRETFEAIDLSNVVPLATLQHLNASVSKNPFGLVAIDLSNGIRG